MKKLLLSALLLCAGACQVNSSAAPEKPLLTFEASLEGQSGVFGSDGVLIEAHERISTPRSPLSADRLKQYKWLRDKPYLSVIDTATRKTVERIPVPEELDYVRFRTMAVDEKRARLIVILQMGGLESDIFTVDLESQTWAQIGTTGINRPNSILYDAATDTFLVNCSEALKNELIGRLSPEGTFSIVSKLDATSLVAEDSPYDPTYDSPPLSYLIGSNEQKVALATGWPFSRHKSNNREFRVNEVDLESSSIRLIYDQ